MDEIDEMIRSGFTLARSLELTAQWDCSLGLVRSILFLLLTFCVSRVVSLGWFHEVVQMLHL